MSYLSAKIEECEANGVHVTVDPDYPELAWTEDHILIGGDAPTALEDLGHDREAHLDACRRTISANKKNTWHLQTRGCPDVWDYESLDDLLAENENIDMQITCGDEDERGHWSTEDGEDEVWSDGSEAWAEIKDLECGW